MKSKLTKTVARFAITAHFVILCCLSFSIPVLAVPQPYVPLAPITGTTPNVNCGDTLRPTGATEEANAQYRAACGTTLGAYITGVFKVGMAVAGALAFLMIVLGGFQYLSTDALTGKEEGKERVTHAVGGLILALTSYIILNTINPKLVALNLDFGRQANSAANLSGPQEYQQNIDRQLTQLAASSARQDLARAAQVTDLRARAASLLAQTADEEDDEVIAGLEEDAAELNRQAQEIELLRGVETVAGERALNAYTPEQLTAAIAAAGTSIQATRDAYTAARAAFASDPARVAALSTEEMDRISVLRKSMAFGMIENPPMNSVVNPATGISSSYPDTTALNAEVGQQINQILAESDAQFEKLRALNAATPNGQGLTTADVGARQAGIRAMANSQICQIKNLCRTKNYSCLALRPDIACAN